MANRIQLRRDTQANWEQVNPILEDGEPGLDITQNKIKYGDGTTHWNSLPYASGGGSTALGNTLVNSSYTLSLGADGVTTFPSGNLSIGTIYGSDAMFGSANTIVGVLGQGISGAVALEWTKDGITSGTGNVAGVILNGPFVPEGVQIATGPISMGGGTYNWAFGSDGNITLPKGGIITEGTIPDAGITGKTLILTPSSGTSATQQLLVYPTAGADANHLHLTSGNLSVTELFLGNDDQYVKLVNNGEVEIRTGEFSHNRNANGSWTFGANASLGLPSSVTGTGSTLISESAITLNSGIYYYYNIMASGQSGGSSEAGAFVTLSFQKSVYPNMDTQVAVGDTITDYATQTQLNVAEIISVGSLWQITTALVPTITSFSNPFSFSKPNATGGTWTFATDGTLTTPGNVTIGSGWGNISMVDTIFANNYVYANGVSILDGLGGGTSNVANLVNGSQTVSLGADGKLTLPNGNFFQSQAGQGETNLQIIDSTNAFKIYTHASSGYQAWVFAADGSTTFPDHANVSMTGTLTVGNLTVNGTTTTINTQSYTVVDNIIQIAADNPADTLDIGFVGHRTVGGTLQHTGLVRDASTGIWELFSNVTSQPGTTVDFTQALLDDLQLDKLYADTIHLTGTAPSTNTGSAGDLAGDIHVDNNYLYYCTTNWSASSWTVGWYGAVSNTIFLVKGDYPTPQVGWTITRGVYTFTIATVTDESNWRITYTGTPYGEGAGGTATLTNPNPAVIWKTIPITAFNTPAWTGLVNAGNQQLGGTLETNGHYIVGAPYGSAQIDLSLGASLTALRQMSGPTGGVQINTSPTDTVAHTWTFDYGGNLVYPDGSKQTTAYTGPTYSNANVASYLVANPQAGTYSNSNVASYLTTYSGNIGGNISIGGALRIYSANSAPFNTNDALYVSGGVTTVGSMASGGNITACAFTKSTSIYSGAIQTNGGIGAWGNINIGESAYITGNINVTGITNVAAISEKFVSNASPASLANVAINFAQTAIVYVTTPSGNITANIQNFSIPSGTVSSVTVWISQGATPYVANSVQINNVMQTVKWQSSATAPAGNASKQDVISFTILNSSGTYTVLGQLATFG